MLLSLCNIIHQVFFSSHRVCFAYSKAWPLSYPLQVNRSLMTALNNRIKPIMAVKLTKTFNAFK